MDKTYGRGKWRCLGRTAILQKGKYRCIDNGKRSKHNKATSMHERITSGRAEFPALMAREFAKRLSAHGRYHGLRLRMKHGTNDIKAAYRRVPTAQPQYSCVAVYNTDANDVQFCDVWGHNFGLKSAVVNFNRFPEMATCAARRLFAVCTEHYVDDNDTSEPAYSAKSGQQSLKTLHSSCLLGFPFDDSKDEDVDESNTYLGVITSFEHLSTGVITMDVSKTRRSKISALVSEVFKANQLRSGLASSLYGSARFAISPCFGCVGKACLQPILAREYQPDQSAITTAIEESLEFIDFLMVNMPAMHVPLAPDDSQPVIIFTDAEGKQRSGSSPPTGHLGFTVIHPIHGKVSAHAAVPSSIIKLLDACKQRQTYIGQFELIAMICPFLSLPAEWFHGRPVELWVDNAGAIGAAIKGYSSFPDHARLVNLFHFTIAKLGLASIWIDYVPSESNIADVPSRAHELSAAELASYASLLGPFTKLVVPTVADDAGNWLSFQTIANELWG